MSAGVLPVTLPHYKEALDYWKELTAEFERQVETANTVLPAGLEKIQLGQQGWNVNLACTSLPSTQVQVELDFESWGPQIRCAVRGEQGQDVHFYPEESDFTVTTDQNDLVIAVTGEGKSLAAHDLAKLVLQHFRRSYPGVTLPCPDNLLS